MSENGVIKVTDVWGYVDYLNLEDIKLCRCKLIMFATVAKF